MDSKKNAKKDSNIESKKSKKTANKDTNLESYDFTLPKNLIAKTPMYPKEDAKLLVYKKDSKKIIHTTFKSLFDFIPKDFLVVLNDTRVIKARLKLHKFDLAELKNISESKNPPESKMDSKMDSKIDSKKEAQNTESTNKDSKQYEILYHRPLGRKNHLVQIKGRAKSGDVFYSDDFFVCVDWLYEDGMRSVRFAEGNIYEVLKNVETFKIMSPKKVAQCLQKHGEMPIPPYMKRESTPQDETDYQSVFAKFDGSIAAPTASLHFSPAMLETLQTQYDTAFVTLHVGAGTFKSVECEDILEHEMHGETCSITHKNEGKILNAEKILCVGTTAFRAVEWLERIYSMEFDSLIDSVVDMDFMESNAENIDYKRDSKGNIKGENKIFLHPKNTPQRANALLTNFHLPKSTLLMLVASLIGLKETHRIYAEAIAQNYRFYSYGDGMLII